MRLVISDISAGGRVIHVTADASASAEAVASALEGTVESLDAELRFRRIRGSDGVRVHGRGEATVSRPCDRCGRPTTLHVTAREELVFEPRPSDDAPVDEIELSESDLDVGFFDGDAIETDDVLSELFALAAPLRVTCGDASCTNTLAEATKDESPKGHPAFAALKDLI